jgi:hypothetical protein
MKQPVLLSQKLGAKSSHIFTQSPLNVTLVCGIDCLACQDEFFVSNPLDFKENDEHALDFAFRLCCLLRSRCLQFPCKLMLYSMNACLIIAKISVVRLLRIAQNLMLFRFGSIARLKVRGRKDQLIHPAA